MAFTVKQDVIKFQVTIDYAFFVKKMQGKYNFSSVKPVAQKIGLNDVVLGQRANVDKCIWTIITARQVNFQINDIDVNQGSCWSAIRNSCAASNFVDIDIIAFLND